MKIMVTGASGFVGNHVITELLKQDVTVIATSTNSNKILDKYWKDKVEYVPFDFRDFSSDINYYSVFREPDKLIHLAWEGLPNYTSLFHLQENLPRHFSLLENMVKNGLKDITVTGTCMEYGLKEGQLKESDPTEPITCYAQAKNLLRVQLEQLQQQLPFQFKWLRLFYMYGEGQSSKSLLSQLQMALDNNETSFNMSGGEQVRDYLPVQKVAEYIVKIALQNEVDGIINCCSGKPVSIKELVQQYLIDKDQHINLNFGYYPYIDYEPMAFWGSIEKLKTVIKAEESIT